MQTTDSRRPHSTSHTPFSRDDSFTQAKETDNLLKLSSEGVKADDHNVGAKTLGTFYSFVFIINQIYGPGVLAIPIVFQQGGWVLTTIVLAAFLLISSFSSTLLCEALSLIPGNKNFEKHIEYSGAVKHFFGRKWYYVFQVFLNLCLQSYNIASIIICAQSVDQFLVFLFGKTCALELLPHPQFHLVNNLHDLYDSTGLSITAGYLVIMCICLPTGLLNLADNVKVVQLISFIALVVLLGEFCGQFIHMGPDSRRVPAMGDQFGQLISVFIFSWAFVMFIPSWVNEKKPGVSVNKVIWASSLASFVGYIAIGLLAAFAFPPLHSDDLLTEMSKPGNPVITIVASYLFSLGVIAPGIPVCLITTRYNLYVGKVCGKGASYFFGVVLPWLVAFCFLQGEVFAMLLNWSSLIVNGIVNFIIPCALYYKAITTVKPTVEKSFENVNASTTDLENKQYSYSSIINIPSSIIESTVAPWPAALRPYAKQLTLLIIVSTGVLLAFGVGIDLYYLIFLHENLIS